MGDPEKKDAAPVKSEEELTKETTEAAKNKPPGVPIDQPGKKTDEMAIQQQRILDAAKRSVSLEEKKILDKFGGTILEMDKIPGNENKGYKNNIYINAPEHPEKFVDKEGKPVPPRVVYYFHGNGGQMTTKGSEGAYIMSQVEKMRANGENVILVIPQDNKGHWKDMEHPQAFKDMQKTVETLMGGKPIKDISITSFSGGYKGVAHVLRNLRENAEKDPESKKLYKNIKQLGFLDSAYGGSEEFASWAADKNHKLFSNYTAACESGNRMLEKAVSDARGGNMEGITIKAFLKADGEFNIHGNAPTKFYEAMRRDGGVRVEPEEAVPEGQNRNTEKISRDDYIKGLGECKTPEERQRFILSLAVRNALSKDCLQERTYETVVNGKKVKVKETGLLEIGGMGLTLDAATSQALADMLGGRLPTAKYQKRLYQDGNVQKVPFFTGEELEARVNKARAEQGLTPLHINLESGGRNGVAMASPDYALAESEQLQEWMKQHNIPKNALTVGNRKVVMAPEGDKSLLTFGGGLYAEYIRDKQTGKIIDVRPSGRIVQNIGDRAHDSRIYQDYSSGTVVETGLEIEGETVSFEQLGKNQEKYKNYEANGGNHDDPSYKKYREQQAIADELFGPGINSRYDYPAWMREYVDEYRKHPRSRSATASTNSPPEVQVETPSAKTAPEARVAPSSSPQRQQAIPAGTEIGFGASPGIPIGGGGGNSGGGGRRSSSETSAPSGQPAPYSGAAQSPQPANPEPAREQVETAISNKVFVIGDSHSMKFAPFLKGPNSVHAHTKKENDSTGASTLDMLNTLKNRVLTQNVKGATLVIVGGTNDIFGPDSLKSIKENLTEIYALAKQKGMKVVGATLPPVGHSAYAKRNWEDVSKNAAYKNRFSSYEEYNKDLIKRWRELNSWIAGRKGAEDKLGKGPDEVVEFHQILENPDLPGSLTKDNYGQGGIHLKDYSIMGNRLRDAVQKLNPKEPEQQAGNPQGKSPQATAESNENTTSFKITSETSSEVTPIAISDDNKRLPLDTPDNPFINQNAKIRKQLAGFSGFQGTIENLGEFANKIRASHEFGAIVYFTDGTSDFVAIKEWHPPYDQRQPNKPQSWHHGVSVLKKNA